MASQWNWRIGRGLVALAAVSAYAATAPGCSYVTNTTAIQCTSEADCTSLAAGTTCDAATKTCVQRPADADLCTTNSDCINRAGGAAAVCAKSTRKCVSLVTPECPVVIDQQSQVVNDDAIIIGSFSPANADFDDGGFGDLVLGGVKLAQYELGTNVKGLPATDGSSSYRPLIVLSCRDNSAGASFEDMLRAANHLVKDIGVPAVIGPIDAGSMQLLATQVFFPNNVLAIGTSGQASINLSTIPSPVAPLPLLWSIQFNEQSIGNTMTDWVQGQIEPKVRAGGSTKTKVAMMVENEYQMGVLADQIEKQLVFNGMSALDNATTTPPAYLRTSVGSVQDKVDFPNPSGTIDAALGAVFAFNPNVVIYAIEPPSYAPVIIPFNAAWPSVPTLPFQIDSLGDLGSFSTVLDFLGQFAPARAKLFSVDLEDSTAQARRSGFELRLSELPGFTNQELQAAAFAWPPQSYYDATYLAAYAIVAAGSKPLTGANLAATLPLLDPPGQLLEIGPDTINTAFGMLAAGRAVDLDGISGNMDINTTNGTVNYSVQVTCPALSSTGAVSYAPSGFYATGETGPASGAQTNCIQ